MVQLNGPTLDPTKQGSVVQDLGNEIRPHLKPEEVKEKKSDRDRIRLFLENEQVHKMFESTVHKQFQSDKNQCKKNKTTALFFKDSGNAYFGKGKYDEALQMYNKCIAWMPADGSKDTPIAYANRSAALFHLGEISLAQQDVKLAFNFKYPKELHYKLHERSGRCYLSQGKTNEAVRSFKQAVTDLQNALLDESKVIKTKKVLDQLIKTASNTKANFADLKVSEKRRADESFLVPELAGGPNKILRSASSKLSVRRNEKSGRFVVANRDIQPGDVIVVQKAFVSSLLPENYYLHCYHCFKQTLAPIPCGECALTTYCSQKCRDTAWSSYHSHECPILGVLANAGISITCYMAVRLVAQAGLKELYKWAQLANETDKADDVEVGNNEEGNKGTTSVGTPGGSSSSSSVQSKRGGDQEINEEYRADHISLFQLVTHSRRRLPEDIFQRSVMAMFLLTLLKRTSLLPRSHPTQQQQQQQQQQHPQQGNDPAVGESVGENNDGVKSSGKKTEEEAGVTSKAQNHVEVKVDMEVKNADELTVGTVLLRCLQFLQFNAHEVAGWDTETFKSSFLGGGLFLTLALFNHSCNPAIVRYFINDTVVVRAVRTIYRGEQVTENYGPLFTANPRAERRATLQNQYWFDCQCICCREDWPTFTTMPSDAMNFRCSSCHSFLGKSTEDSPLGLLLQCRRCSKPTNILKSLKDLQAADGRYNEAIEFLNKGREQTALGILLQNIALFDSILYPPFRDYHMCQEAARRCFLALGNKTYTYSH